MHVNTFQAARAAYYRTLTNTSLRHQYRSCCTTLTRSYNCLDRVRQDATQNHMDAMQAAAAYRGMQLEGWDA